MSDDTEAEPLDIDIELDAESPSDWHEYSGAGSSLSGVVIFPGGVEVFAAAVGAIALRIADKAGDIEILTELGKPWRQVDKPSGAVSTIKPAPRRTD